MRRAIATLTLLAGLVAGGTSAVRAEQQTPRDLYVKSANADGTLICAKWCNETEVCC